ncbi:siphovirus Gp157 family protein [Alloacidobacterium dinghuense]|uniref:Siphovirus Gp157 family protein n=1 Tax=Alloacidobacterium dinghuense TaxID=2763107 RepID=A0A7G8BJU9_9BACT|nr:siphovirus Gp157 family protein [Alloacidobacterium dinghuense]QNI32819.1 siphovirus Gp157 family protein [Alloacidobacterium dinghuense]
MASKATPLIPFQSTTATQSSPTALATDHSLLELDFELDALLDQIQDEIDDQGEASAGAMERLQLFCQAMDVKIDRIGRFLRVMETRAEHCKKESARYAARARRALSKIERTESMVLYYLPSHDLKKIESHEFTLKRNKNSQNSVEITQPDSIPNHLRRFEAKIDGPLWIEVIEALPKTLAEPLAASVKSEPSNSAIKQHIANGGMIEGASIKRGYHLRIE